MPRIRTIKPGVGIIGLPVTRASVPPNQLREGECVLYRLLNSQAECIYVGITTDPLNRWQAHLAGKDWAPEVSAIYYISGLTERRARFLEREAIRVDAPKYDRTMRSRRASA